MGSRLNPYLFFTDRAAEALEFYRSVFGGSVEIRTFGQMGLTDTADTDRIMHGRLTTPEGFVLMCADTPAGMAFEPGRSMAVCLNGEDGEDLHRWFDGLSAGGQVVLPLEEQMWGDEFGQVVDRFGVVWLAHVTRPGGTGTP